MFKSEKSRVVTSVLASGFVGSIVAPGAVYCAEEVLPHQMTWMKRWMAEHVVEPHVGWFEKTVFKGIYEAHERYDRKKRETLIHEGLQVPLEDRLPETKQERAAVIADAMVTRMTALGFDFLAAIGLQKFFNSLFSTKVSPHGAATVEMLATMAAVAGMHAPVMARVSENINHSSSRFLRKLGMEKGRAENLSDPFAYVSVPSFASTLVTVCYALWNTRER